MAEKKEILLTGAKGQLASDLLPLLKAAGLGVSAFDSAKLDVTNRDKVFDAVQKARPDVIINCAAYTKVDLAEKEHEKAFAVNARGAKNIAEAAKELDAAIIHVSTDFVFDGLKNTPYTETDAVNPLGVYARTKLDGERFVIDGCRRHFVVRASWLYGATGQNFVKTILKLASERDVLRVVYDQIGNPTWTADLAAAITLMACEMDNVAPGVYHYSNEGVASWYDLSVAIIEEAARYTGPFKCKEILPIVTGDYPTPAKRPAYSVMDKTKIKKALPALKIPHWRASLRKMLEEFYGKSTGKAG